MSADFTSPDLTPEEVLRRKTRQVSVPMLVSLAAGVALRLAETLREDETISEGEKMELYKTLPRNRAEARRMLRGNGPWGLARKPR